MKRILLFLLLCGLLFAETAVCPILGEYRITSGVGYRENPFIVGGPRGFHRGIDMSASEGTPILSSYTGKVIDHWPAPDGYYKGHPDFGGMIIIQDADGCTLYGHMCETFVHEGDYIVAGQMIGRVGNTGKSTGAHLHFERIAELHF